MQWACQEYQQSVHSTNRTGVRAGCHDCHIPHHYPALLWYKAKAGIKDAIGEMRGVISTEEKFNKERLRMAKEVWAEYKEPIPKIAAIATSSPRTSSPSRRISCSQCTSSFSPGR
jgi:nitrate/TMAO reductase-like tetraheme cytochrome c subunit